MCFSFLLEYDQAKSNESFETEKAVSYLMLNIRIENIIFFLLKLMVHGGSRQQSSWLHKLKLQQKQQNKWSMQKIVTEH